MKLVTEGGAPLYENRKLLLFTKHLGYIGHFGCNIGCNMLAWMRQEPQISFPSSVVLEFPHIDANLNTNAFQYEQTLSVFDGLTLQTLRKLSQARESCLHQSARKSGADLHALELRYVWGGLCLPTTACACGTMGTHAQVAAVHCQHG